MQKTYIIFEVAGASYAAPSDQVVVLEMVDKITHVPNAPEFVEGVTVVRGQIIPVINVRRRFHMEPIPLDVHARLVVIRVGERQVGMLVDKAREFARIPSDLLHPAEGITGPGVEYLDEVAALPGRLILVVNLERLLSFEERQTLVAQEDISRQESAPAPEKSSARKQKETEKTASPVDAASMKRSRKG